MSKWIGVVALTSALLAGPAFAAAPTTTLVEGMLTSGGGGPAADGSYNVTFSLWAGKTGGTAAWTEGPVKVAVKGGQFHYALGTTKALDAKKLAALKAQWLGVKIGTDPALPRQKVHATLFALHATSASTLTCTGCLTSSHLAGGSVPASKVGFTYAGSDTKGGAAKDLKCTGCVSVSEMKFDGNANFGGFSIKAKNGTFTGGVAAATVTASTFLGDGSKLTGIKIPKGECTKKGEVVKGINADGTLKCVAALEPSALPHDGLNEISNNLITNQFIYTQAAALKKVRIPDNQGTEGVSNITFPNIGVAQTLEIKIAVENTDLSTLSLVLLPPDDKKTGWVLCDPCGKKDTKKYAKTFSPKVLPQAQKGGGKKIGAFIGTNLQGLWTLKAKDTSFCIVQAPGNAPYCDTKNKKDGWITDWSIKMQYVSNKKIAITGNMDASGGITSGGFPVPTNNAKVHKKLFAELAGNNWKQCSWHNLNSGTDVGLVVTCPYVKNYDNTALRLVWSGTLRSGYGGQAKCKEWYFTIDGKECSKPAAVEGVKYQNIPGASWSDLHHTATIEGICSQAGGAIKKGKRSIEFRIRNCGGYGNNDGYTGWNSTSRIIIQELPLGQ